jgi:hypothetical protein
MGRGWAYSSVIEHIFGMQEVMGSIYSTRKKRNEDRKCKRPEKVHFHRDCSNGQLA